MAVTTTVLKLHNQEAVVKVAGTAATGTIDLDGGDITATAQALISGGTQKVSIAGYHVILGSGATATITRNSVNVMTFAGPIADFGTFNSMGFLENTEEDQDINVVIAGGEAQVYLILRKTDGWETKVETATFGAFDDTTAVGS